MAQEQNPVVHVNSPSPDPASVSKGAVGNLKAAGKARMKGITKRVHALGSR